MLGKRLAKEGKCYLFISFIYLVNTYFNRMRPILETTTFDSALARVISRLEGDVALPLDVKVNTDPACAAANFLK